MKMDEKLRKQEKSAMWDEYCGFLDLDIEGYMSVQNRLMMEQLSLWRDCGLGKAFLKGSYPGTVEEFRAMVPLTQYEDYAPYLLTRREDMLPARPSIWIETAWEGSLYPSKVAPYTQSMLETYRNNMAACMLLCSSTGRKKYNIGKKVLSGFAPLPYETGLLGFLLQQETSMEFLPPAKEAAKLSVSEQTKQGLKLGLKRGIDYFFSMGSVAYFISNSIQTMLKNRSSGGSGLSVRAAARYLRAKESARRENRDILPKDLFRLNGFVCAGTDNRCYKDELEKMWGIRPMEIFAGTEPTLIGCETWNRNDLYFFPDACYYEFLPYEDVLRLSAGEEYEPSTLDMSLVRTNERYELVISVLKGGAFARYRTGDLYVCTGIGSAEDETSLPRFRYVDRIPDIIDIAGFTRITRNTVDHVIELSHLPIGGYVAAKEFNADGHPFLHLYVEVDGGNAADYAMTSQILREHLSVYFRYLDSDYKDLKRILGMDPLEITLIRSGVIEAFRARAGRSIRTINPPANDLSLLRSLESSARTPREGGTL